MKKKLLIILIIALIAGGGVAAYLVLRDDKKSEPPIELGKSRRAESQNTVTETPESKAARSACEIFSLDDSKATLGSSAVADGANTDPPKDSGDVINSNCSYTVPAADAMASLLVRIAKNAQGSANDKELFGSQKPENSQDVNGYGDAAYWNADFGQLNILKGNTWYVITVGPQVAAERTLEQAKKMADVIKAEL